MAACWFQPEAQQFEREARRAMPGPGQLEEAANAADLGFAQPPIDRGDTLLRRFRCGPVCVLPRAHALAARSCIIAWMLHAEAFIALARDPTSRMAIAEAFEVACHMAVVRKVAVEGKMAVERKMAVEGKVAVEC
jgi:hypothetical protein